MLAVLAPLAQARSFAPAMPRMSYGTMEHAAANRTPRRTSGKISWHQSKKRSKSEINSERFRTRTQAAICSAQCYAAFAPPRNDCGEERRPMMMELPEMLKLLGRMSGLIGLICAVIGIVLGVGILLKENPALALGLSLSVIGLVIAITESRREETAKNYWKSRSGGACDEE